MYLILSVVLFISYVIKLDFLFIFFISSIFLFLHILVRKRVKYSFVFILILTILSFFYSLITPYDSVFFKVSFSSIFFFILIFYVYRDSLNYTALEKLLKYLFRLNLIFFISMFLWSFSLGMDYRLIWELLPFGVSVNYYMSTFLILTIYAFFQLNSSFDKLLIIFSNLLMIFTESRVVSVVAFIVLCLSLSKMLIRSKYTISFYLTLIVFIVSYFLLIGGEFSIHELEHYDFISESRFFSKGLDSPRFDMLSEYIESVGYWELLFGADFIHSPTIMMWDYNPHNSIIRAHSSFGLLSFFMMASYLIVINLLIFKCHRSGLKFFLYSVFLLSRSMFDSVLIFTSVDFILLLSLLIIYNNDTQYPRLDNNKIPTKKLSN